MKIVFLLLLLGAGWCIDINCYGQTAKRDSKVFIIAEAKDVHGQEVKKELAKQIEEWGYWKVAARKEDAGFFINLNVQTHRGMTAWSWGGVTVRASASIEDKGGETLWQSKEYKANPNGTNSFNTAHATVNKIVKEMQRAFR